MNVPEDKAVVLERFVRDYSGRAYSFACALCGNGEEAKELVQEAFCRALKKWKTYDRAQSFENWFLTILRNIYYDSMKRYERRRVLSLEKACVVKESSESAETELCYEQAVSEEKEDSLWDALERRESAALVRGVLGELTEEHRAVLVLCDMEALSYDDISKVLGCPIGTVRSRLSRARSAFRERFLRRSGVFDGVR